MTCDGSVVTSTPSQRHCMNTIPVVNYRHQNGISQYDWLININGLSQPIELLSFTLIIRWLKCHETCHTTDDRLVLVSPAPESMSDQNQY